jgi:nickel-dependent lactate racemase
MHDFFVLDGARHIRLDVERLAARAEAFDVEPHPRLQPFPKIDRAIAEALARPVGAAPLRELARGARRVVVAIPDGTRPCPTFLLLPAVLDELNAAGVDDAQIHVLVACGVHRVTTAEEKATLAGQAASSRVAVADAQGLRQVNVFLNQTRHRAPVFMNLGLARADLVVALGIVEPHLYAGFSGGAKTVAIGCAGARTIAWTHDPRFLDQPGVELGRLAGNPFQETVREIAGRTALRFALDAVVDERGHAAARGPRRPAAGHAQRARGPPPPPGCAPWRSPTTSSSPACRPPSTRVSIRRRARPPTWRSVSGRRSPTMASYSSVPTSRRESATAPARPTSAR